MHLTEAMRFSLWLLFGVASLTAVFWLLLVLNSGFAIWRSESNVGGLIVQGALIVFPISLLFGLNQSKGSSHKTAALFVFAWSIVLAVFLLLGGV